MYTNIYTYPYILDIVDANLSTQKILENYLTRPQERVEKVGLGTYPNGLLRHLHDAIVQLFQTRVTHAC